MFIKMPNNLWFTGRHYEYNKDQDMTRKEIKLLITADTFVKDTDYDTEGYNLVYTDVRYKQFKDTSTRGGYATGNRQSVKERQIETNNEMIVFNENDRFRLMNQEDEETPLKITNVAYNRNSYNSKASLLLPGLFKEHNSNTVLTLR